MNILLTTLNAKFIHSNLALRTLKAYCRKEYPNINIMEHTINDPLEQVVSDLVEKEPNVLCFSCYIWNIRQTLDVIDTVKKVVPDCIIVLGGPEVTYDGVDLMQENKLIDYIVSGEGERTFKELLDCIVQNREPAQVKGLVWRSNGQVIYNGNRPPLVLDDIPFAYEDGFQDLKNKIIYYETSRGCPFNCQYCLSSTTGKVRFLSLKRVKKELAFFIRSGARQVKLVDRTFNCNPARAKEIFRYLIDLGGKTNFHFEMAGDLIDDEMLDILSQAPVGLFQFEIGIQSTKQDTLEAIKRKTDLDKIASAVVNIIKMDNIHVHLDLIAGLPEEDISSMIQSINKVMQLSPHRLQLGFLKLLKGSGLREEEEKYKYRYTSYPPYEVLSNHVLSYKDLIRLKRIEELIEKYYNSHRFDRSLAYLIRQTEGNAFIVFDRMAEYWRHYGYFCVSHSHISLYEYLLHFAETLSFVDVSLFKQLLLFDFLQHSKPGRYPNGLKSLMDEKTSRLCDEFLRNEDNLNCKLPEWKGHSPGQIKRKVHIEVFDYRLDLTDPLSYQKGRVIILFDYANKQGVLKKSRIVPLAVYK